MLSKFGNYIAQVSISFDDIIESNLNNFPIILFYVIYLNKRLTSVSLNWIDSKT